MWKYRGILSAVMTTAVVIIVLTLAVRSVLSRRTAHFEFRVVTDKVLHNPTCIASGGNNRIYIVDNSDRCVKVFRLSRHSADLIGIRRMRFSAAYGIAVNAQDSTVYVTDYLRDCIIQMNADHLVNSSTTTEKSWAIVESPCGVAVAANGEVYVVSSGKRQVVVLDKNGSVLRAAVLKAVNGRKPGLWGIAIGTDGLVYVSDIHNQCVQVLDRQLNHIRVVPPRGKRRRLICPRGVAVDAYGNLYVADSANGCVQVFDRSGEFLQAVMMPPVRRGHYIYPSAPFGVSSSPDGRDIYVSDVYNGRILAVVD